MTTGPKISRRDLKEDKVYVSLASLVDLFVRNRLIMALVALGIVSAFAAGYYLSARSNQKAAEASWEFYQTAFMEPSAEKTAAIKKIVTDYKGTQAAVFASFELANSLYDDGKYEEASEAFRSFLQNNRNHVLAPFAAEATGYCSESLGQWKEAVQIYENLLRDRPDSHIVAAVNYRLGICYEKLGEKKKAIGAYEKTVELAPESMWAEDSSQRLASLSPETHALAEEGSQLPPGLARPFASPVPPPVD